MADSNDAQKPGKKLSADATQKLREQLANKVADLSDDELSEVAGGTTTAQTITTVIVDPGEPVVVLAIDD